ncbi:helix-turn-helix domain-containing protein [Aurantiacibacter zhengii]|uniref:XRE family transcriptional regulator n=1 Tax=Aurantiacibacter zhengii TaxID=2307003 RepID=A0A418NU00_9SPHN|nr:helix-turn-helix transcriptional regulator [Aurantiacibacter zhengii]RIV87481.1 XRE family transcriptional regulator [Aurantiacibacter zhengii]
MHPLKEWRLANNLTLAQAAQRVGTSRQVWFDWEGRRRIPSATFMPRIKHVTGGEVTADDFYCGKNDDDCRHSVPSPITPNNRLKSKDEGYVKAAGAAR